VGGEALDDLDRPLSVNLSWAATDQDSGDAWIWAAGIADASFDDNVTVTLDTTEMGFMPITRMAVIDPADGKWYVEFANMLADPLMPGTSYSVSVEYEDDDAVSDKLYGRIFFQQKISF
jgi:hypothetical protein